ncbi:MAG: adenosylcobinamide-phosphate synthase CbiB [Velocimicrobium sp.]
MLDRVIALIIGYSLDLIFGDPLWLWHPVMGIGKLIHWGQKRLEQIFSFDLEDSNKRNQTKERIAGVILVVFVLAIPTAFVFVILCIAGKIHPLIRIFIEAILCYQILAIKSLKTESMKVYRKLYEHDLDGARRAVSMIVGRDTNLLSEEGITKATVETIAENTSDGVIAPMFCFLVGGAMLGILYKAANTMDSMIGYKNDHYMHFGRAAAKFDDIINYIPARIAAVFMIASAYLLQLNGRGAIEIFKRDRYKHASPNSAQTEAVCAGALSIELAGDASYFGRVHHKQTIGDAKQRVEMKDIKRANGLLYMTSLLFFLVSCAILIYMR